MITKEMTQAAYLSARDALDKLAKTRTGVKKEHRKAARTKRDALDRSFIDQNIEAVEARTALYESFISDMNALISDIGKDSSVEAVRTLKSIVDSGAAAIKAAKPQ
jgi:hypothetical protein